MEISNEKTKYHPPQPYSRIYTNNKKNDCLTCHYFDISKFHISTTEEEEKRAGPLIFRYSFHSKKEHFMWRSCLPVTKYQCLNKWAEVFKIQYGRLPLNTVKQI
jgi:hypothetical protein